MSDPHIFRHEAMKTTFSFHIVHDDAKLASDVAHASIALLDEIENTLSRYIAGSDVWLINQMRADETRFLSEFCYECLRLAVTAHVETGGLFDITLGRQIEHQKNDVEGTPPLLEGQLMVDPDKPSIHCIEAGREIDLGGIGKGFALDKIKDLMCEWGIENALLSAGGSTQLAFGPKSWDIELKGDHSELTLQLSNESLSASGIGIQGSHIVSPREDIQSYQHGRIWCIHPTATLADAWTTAMMLMNAEEMSMVTDRGLKVYYEDEHGIGSF